MITEQDIGHRVEDAFGRVGILRDLDPEWEDPAAPPHARYKRPTAFLWPEQGGREWHADPRTVKRA
ncbi:hypothetical protein [Streptomyces erythrochromogenes]|uniref:hypothetical protein n=1 Tax=Streptomyces erythrochromogenes TaxID=285574 RepID=UPI0036973F3B